MFLQIMGCTPAFSLEGVKNFRKVFATGGGVVLLGGRVIMLGEGHGVTKENLKLVNPSTTIIF